MCVLREERGTVQQESLVSYEQLAANNVNINRYCCIVGRMSLQLAANNVNIDRYCCIVGREGLQLAANNVNIDRYRCINGRVGLQLCMHDCMYSRCKFISNGRMSRKIINLLIKAPENTQQRQYQGHKTGKTNAYLLFLINIVLPTKLEKVQQNYFSL